MSDQWIKPSWQTYSAIVSLITTRDGGVSQPPYDSLNLGAHVGDDEQSVNRNRALLTQYLPAKPVWLEQVHGTEVFDADHWDQSSVPVADAAVTTQPQRVLCIMTADCLPVLLASKGGEVIGVAHAGWRGLAAGIIEKTIQKMKQKLDQDIQIQAFLGPAIGPESFQVGQEVKDIFEQHDPNSSQAFKPCSEPMKYWADIYQLARMRLHSQGVEQVDGGDRCTLKESCFYSYRRDQVTGRMASLLWIKESQN